MTTYIRDKLGPTVKAVREALESQDPARIREAFAPMPEAVEQFLHSGRDRGDGFAQALRASAARSINSIDPAEVSAHLDRVEELMDQLMEDTNGR